MGCWWFSRVTFLLSELVETQDFWNLCVVLLLEMVAQATLVLGQLDFFMFCLPFKKPSLLDELTSISI